MIDSNKDLSVVSFSRKGRCKCKQYLVELTYIQSQKKLILVKKEALILSGKTKID